MEKVGRLRERLRLLQQEQHHQKSPALFSCTSPLNLTEDQVLDLVDKLVAAQRIRPPGLIFTTDATHYMTPRYRRTESAHV